MIRYFNQLLGLSIANLTRSSLVVALPPDSTALIGATSRHRIARSASRLRFLRAPIETSRRQATSMDCLFEDSRYLLRECSMFGSSAATQRFLEVVGNVRTDKNSFAISHLHHPLIYVGINQPCNYGTGL